MTRSCPSARLVVMHCHRQLPVNTQTLNKCSPLTLSNVDCLKIFECSAAHIASGGPLYPMYNSARLC